MAFGTRGNNNSSSSEGVKVDWEGLNKHVVETAGLQQPETLVGIISSIIDLGIQQQEDAKIEFDGDEEAERKEIAENPNTYFETLPDYGDGGKMKRYKRFPTKAVQCVCVTVDFPDIIVDKGQFFGNSDPKPLRLLLGGEFTPKGGKTIVAKPLALTKRKNAKTNNVWSLPFNHTLYKMAVAAKLVEQGNGFLPEDIDKLLGKALQFKAQVYLNEGKYFTEKCAFAASLSRGQVAPVADPNTLCMIQFMEDNDENQVKQLRASVKNTMRNASDFEGSKIAEMIGDGNYQKAEEKVDNSKEEEDLVDSNSNDNFDDDIPF